MCKTIKEEQKLINAGLNIGEIYLEIEDNIISFKKRIEEKFKEKISKLKSLKKGKIVVIYHGADIDGHFIKILSEVFRLLDNRFEFVYKPCFKKADEAIDFINENLKVSDFVIVGDLSFTEEYCEIINDNQELKDKLIVLDHHESALYMNKYDFGLVIPNDIYNFNLSSGTLLYACLLILINIEENDNYNIMFLIKQLAINVAAYDTWFANDLKTEDICKELNYILGKDFTTLFKFNKESFANDTIEYIKMLKWVSKPNDYIKLTSFGEKESIIDQVLNSIDIINNIIKPEQRSIIDINNKFIQNVVSNAWHGSIIGNIGEHKFAVVYIHNYSSEVGNYILKHQEELDFVIEIMMNSQNISFRSRTDEYNVSELAVLNGGGGHPASSGTDYILKKCDVYNMSLKDILYRIFSKKYSNEDIDNMSLKRIKEYNFDEEKHVYVID